MFSCAGAVGLDDNDKQRTADAEAAAKREAERKQERRVREKKEIHNQKEGERKNIRSKYQLPKSTNAKRTSTNAKRTTPETESPSENKCTIS